jgi:MFS family permease
MNVRIGFRLCVMMALVYAVQGAFWPLLAVHLDDLGVAERARGWIFATFAMGSLAIPLGVGQLVDRYFAAQRTLAAILAVSAGFLVLLASGVATSSLAIFGLFLAFWMVMAPAFSLAAAIAMRHLPEPPQQFSGVRLWGTVGWMVVGWFVSCAMVWSGSSTREQGVHEAFWVAAALAVLLSGYSLTLPNTPPLAGSARPELAGLAAVLQLVRAPLMRRFLLTSLGVSMTSTFVYQILPPYLVSHGLPRSWITGSMTLGQVPEIAALAVLPWLINRIGIRGTMLVGLFAWCLRFGSLACDPPLWVAIGGIPLQGVGFACFTVAGQVFIDSQAPSDHRAGAQGLYFVVTSGIGVLLGSVLAGDVMGSYSGDYALVFLVPCVIDLSLLVYFYAGFRPHPTTAGHISGTNVVDLLRKDAVRGTIARAGNLVTEAADG